MEHANFLDWLQNTLNLIKDEWEGKGKEIQCDIKMDGNMHKLVLYRIEDKHKISAEIIISSFPNKEDVHLMGVPSVDDNAAGQENIQQSTKTKDELTKDHLDEIIETTWSLAEE